MNLPHRFPFRWIEREEEGVARAMVTANSAWLRGDAAMPAPFLAEVVAQAAAVLLADPEAGSRELWLAGIDRLEMHRQVRAGEVLEVAVVAGRRFGTAMQVKGRISCGGDAIAEVVLLLV